MLDQGDVTDTHGTPAANLPPSLSVKTVVTWLNEGTVTSDDIVIATIEVIDDGVGVNNLSLAGEHSSLFKFSGNRLVLKKGTVLDAQATPRLFVTIRVNDVTVGNEFDDLVDQSVTIVAGNLNVKMFGAVGDGITDDTAALQAALDAAQGRELYIDPGTYLISDSLFVPSNTVITGAGDATVLKFNWRDQFDGPSFHLGNRNRADEQAGDENIELRNFTVVGGDTGDPYGPADHTVTHGISFRKAMNVLVTGVTVRNTSGFGIANTGVINGTYTNNLIENTGRDGITSFPLIQEGNPSVPYYPLDNILIENNTIRNVGDDGIAVHAGTEYSWNLTHPPTNITIRNNVITGRITSHEMSQGRGIALTGVHHATIEGNQIDNTVSTGILLQPWYNYPYDEATSEEIIRTTDIVIINNVIDFAGVAEGLDRLKIGIQVKGSDVIQIKNNIIRDSADRGMDIRNTTKINIVDNTVQSSQGEFGLLVGGGPDYDVIDLTVWGNIIDHWNENGLFIHNAVNVTEGENILNIIER
ncbi:MAG: hypothetical protein CMJ46_04090 [Planctomyces sp.]|nr:hypothetical protein [Planctomyces sp.]